MSSWRHRAFAGAAFAWTIFGGLVPLARTATAQRSVSRGLTAVAIDTVIQPGHRDYSRYTSPSMCLEAVGRVRLNATRLAAPPPNPAPVPGRETLPDSMIAAARQCAKAFTAASVASAQLLDYMELAFDAGNDAEALAAMDRWRATMPADPDNRGWALLTLMDIVVNVPPVRLPLVEKLTTELNALGAPAAVQRMKAESWWIQLSWARWDTVAIERHAYAYLTAYAQMSPERSQLWTQFLSGSAAGSWGRYMGGQYPIVGDMQAGLTLARLKAATAPSEIGGLRALIAQRTGARIADSEWGLMSIYQTFTTPVPYPPLPATTWFGTHGAHEWPVRGRPSLYVNLTEYLQTGTSPDNLYSLLRHVYEKFGDTVNMTIVYNTRGYFGDGPPMDAAEESEEVRKHFLDDLKLPVNLAVIVAPMDTLPDGRRFAGSVVMDTLTGYRANGGAFDFGLADAKGMSVLRSPSWPSLEPELDAYLKRALHQSTGSAQ